VGKGKEFKPAVIVGSSGSFDTFKDYIYNCKYRDLPSISLAESDLEKMNDVMMRSTIEERMNMPGMSPVRVDFIVLSSLFTKLVIDNVKPQKIFQSSYSLKEGGVYELYEKWKCSFDKK
jgi:Exopolyphosphatase